MIINSVKCTNNQISPPQIHIIQRGPSREDLEINQDYAGGKWRTEGMAASVVGAEYWLNSKLTLKHKQSLGGEEEIGRIENTLNKFQVQ